MTVSPCPHKVNTMSSHLWNYKPHRLSLTKWLSLEVSVIAIKHGLICQPKVFWYDHRKQCYTMFLTTSKPMPLSPQSWSTAYSSPRQPRCALWAMNFPLLDISYQRNIQYLFSQVYFVAHILSCISNLFPSSFPLFKFHFLLKWWTFVCSPFWTGLSWLFNCKLHGILWSLEYIPKIEISGSYGNYIFKLLKNYQTAFQSD